MFQYVRDGDINIAQLDRVRIVLHQPSVTTGEQGNAGWRADGIAGIRLCKSNAVLGEPVEVRRLDRSVAIRTNLIEAEIVSKDQDDVRPVAVYLSQT